MLSTPSTGLHPRQKQHRRQNSTPTAFEGVKITNLPHANQRRAVGHRRGMSLDTRQQHTKSPTTRQDYTVSMNTNTGIAPTSQHHVLREAQQQRIIARPGPRQSQPHYASQAPNDGDNYLISPHGTPHTQRFDVSSCFDSGSIPFNLYGDQLSMMMQKNQASYGNNMTETKDFDLFTAESALSTPTFMNFSDSPSAQGWMSEGGAPDSRRSSRRISDGIMDRVSKFENLGIEELQAPMTPPSQNDPIQDYYPPTPMGTPHDRLLNQQESRPNRFSANYDESMEETLKPVRSRPNQRAQNIFQETRQNSEQHHNEPSPPTSGTMPSTSTFVGVPTQNADYMNLRHGFIKTETDYNGISYESNGIQHSSELSHHPSPALHDIDQFIGGLDGKPEYQSLHEHLQSDDGREPCTPSSRTSHHRRTESVASVASAASIASINIEDTKTDTGVTVEEISQFIRGPDTPEGKWTCIFEDCGKMFGRKENIKSHVQTHLNDRQYQCPTCKKCFVRQHDLKRHAKIHTGVKPYPCECGNSFARHDALTRHRQRGMCIGAFDGIVRKVVKRGRPRKNRPDMDTRMEKSARTRKKNMSISSMSSQSGYSDSSAAASPENDFDMIDYIKPIVLDAATEEMASMSSAPMPSLQGRVIHEAALSPSVVSVHSYVSPGAVMDKALSQPTSPAKSSTSHYNTPPELSQSSSPPAAHIYDVEPNTSCEAEGLSVINNTHTSFDQEDDLLLQFTNNDDSLVQFDRDSSLLMMSKFDEEFDNAVGMFTNNDDVFFDTT